MILTICRSAWTFQSTPPARGATQDGQYSGQHHAKFQSTPPARGATMIWMIRQVELVFQSTPPARGATPRVAAHGPIHAFQSTPPARGATCPPGSGQKRRTNISIHAPREGGDSGAGKDMIRQIISIHAPREGGDVPVMYLPSRLPVFQSTPPARGATLRPAAAPAPASYFNPRPPRGGRLLGCGLGVVLRQISIHAPREGGDLLLCYRNSVN